MSVEKYLKPSVINQIKRLDLRAQFVVKGFLHGLHASPFHGFSVEFSEHRKYTAGDDLKDIDWQVYAKTDKYYIKKFESETNITGYLLMDLSQSMGYTYEQELNKFDYAITVCDNAKDACPVYTNCLNNLHWSYSDPADIVDFNARKQNCHFLLNKESCLSQNGDFFKNKGAVKSDLVNLFGNEEDSLILIDNFLCF